MGMVSHVFTETSPAAASTVASSAAVTNSTVAGVAIGLLDGMTCLQIFAALVGATGGTLDVYLQNSPDFGVSWQDYAHWPQLAAGAAAVKYTMNVSAYAQSVTMLTPVGVDLTPSLGANTCVGGTWGDRFRLVFVAGAGTSVGAAVSVRIVGQKSP